MKRRFSPRQYAERLRRQRRRLYLQDGVLSVRFIKFLEVQTCTRCLQPRAACLCHQPDFDEAAGLICSACGHRYVSPETWMCGSCGADANEVPWPGGAA